MWHIRLANVRTTLALRARKLRVHTYTPWALCMRRCLRWTYGPVRWYVFVLSEHIEDMRATRIAHTPFKGGLRSKPPDMYPCEVMCEAHMVQPCDGPYVDRC